MIRKNIITGLLIAALFFACKTAQQKENKLYDRAAASRSLLERLAPNIFALWPCVNDTAYIITHGSTDSAAIKDVVTPPMLPIYKGDSLHVDTAALKERTTVAVMRAYETLCNKLVLEAFNSGVAQTAAKYNNLKVPVKSTDTITGLLKDRRQLQSLTDSINAVKRQLSNAQGVIAQLNKDAKHSEKVIIWLAIILAFSLAAFITTLFKKFPL